MLSQHYFSSVRKSCSQLLSEGKKEEAKDADYLSPKMRRKEEGMKDEKEKLLIRMRGKFGSATTGPRFCKELESLWKIVVKTLD